MAGVRGRLASQKWSKGKVKEKLANLVLFDKTTYEKMLTDVPKQKLITPSIISEKLKVNGSLARKAVRELVSQGLIRKWRAAPKHRPRPRPAVASSHHLRRLSVTPQGRFSRTSISRSTRARRTRRETWEGGGAWMRRLTHYRPRREKRMRVSGAARRNDSREELRSRRLARSGCARLHSGEHPRCISVVWFFC